MKGINIFSIIILLLVAAGLYAIGGGKQEPETTNQVLPVDQRALTGGKAVLGDETFFGELQEVNTGCFADGECYAVVDGKHITLLIGWSQETVGEIIGSDGIGGLEAFVGTEVEVFAGSLGDDRYTLYGDRDYYLKTKGSDR